MPCSYIIEDSHNHHSGDDHATGFSTIDATQLEKYELDKRLCFDSNSVFESYVYGNEQSDEYAHFTIQIEKCINTTI